VEGRAKAANRIQKRSPQDPEFEQMLEDYNELEQETEEENAELGAPGARPQPSEATS
jgi:hypothetical protein